MQAWCVRVCARLPCVCVCARVRVRVCVRVCVCVCVRARARVSVWISSARMLSRTCCDVLCMMCDV